MSRFKPHLVRWTFNFLTILSALLLLFTLVFWAKLSKGHPGFAWIPTPHKQFTVMAVERVVVLRFSVVPWPLHRGFERQSRNMSISRSPTDGSDVGTSLTNGSPSGMWLWEFAGFALRRCAYPYSSHSGTRTYEEIDYNAWIPYWMLTIIFAAMPAWWFFRVRRQRLRTSRRERGCCEHCGYDLRATPGQCPECGALP
ncbi:MAG TPA: hypothetical protein VL282_08985 [Tepidisphaeraceae bacterium]|nr:hypothetical protein [Tepidisphaeraceae bacterium]